MNYFPFHIGDYASATRHLSWDEDCAYRRLLDVCYTTERPLPTEERALFRLVMAQSDMQREAVRAVIGEFFDATPDGYLNRRVAAELQAMQEKQEKARQSAHARWGKRGTAAPDDTAMRSQSPEHAAASPEACDGIAPNTNTNTNTKDKKARGAPRFDAVASLVMHGVSEEVAREWIGHRKAKRAPVTDTVVANIAREASKAGWSVANALQEMMLRGWTGFKGEWIDARPARMNPADLARVTVPGPKGEDPALKKIREDEANASPMPPEVRAKLNQLTRKPMTGHDRDGHG